MNGRCYVTPDYDRLTSKEQAQREEPERQLTTRNVFLPSLLWLTVSIHHGGEAMAAGA